VSRRTLLAALLSALAVLLGAVVPGAAPAGAAANYPVPYNFIPFAITGGVNLHEAAPGANDWSCQPSAAHPEPVVLAHGLFGNANTNWQTYGPLLANEGYCVYALTYGVLPNATLPLNLFGGLTTIESSAGEIAAFVDRVLGATGASKVDIVGHSEGTVVPDYYAKFLGGATKIDKYISLAPLWHGTDPLNLSLLTGLGVPAGASTAAVSGSFGEMSPGSPFLVKLRSGGTPAVAGITYTNIVTRYDELVSPYTSGIEPGMTNIVVQNQCGLDFTEHFEIASDPVAAADVLNALDPAHPRPVPCRLVLPFVGPLIG
jgi:triacylglycerol lipase